jgi:polyferredoxin
MNSTATKDSFRDSLAIIDDAKGKRVWVYPKSPAGQLHRLRKGVAVVLLTLLFGTPLIHVNGHPFFLFNILERKFILFGYPFFPQDFHLFGLAMITFFVFIILFTVVFGRVWCGWACPQTIFMEMVFRKIEYWIEGDANAQKALTTAPWTLGKFGKKAAKHGLFLFVALLIAHTMMAWLIGLNEVMAIVTQPPTEHWTGFLGLLAFTIIFYLVFARLRELACTLICPYGRLQGVLLTKETILVAYDFVRGEPRGRLKKEKKTDKVGGCSGNCAGCTGIHQHAEKLGTAADVQITSKPLTLEHLLAKGDCIDCKLCVQVCPMGIDIRNGIQMECINCTACIDACDGVMDKIGKPRGLIRFDSQQGIEQKKPLRVTARMVAYSVVLLALLSVMGFLIVNRNMVEATVLRVPGMLYQEQKGGRISNLYNVQVVNKTFDPLQMSLKLDNQEQGSIRVVGGPIKVAAGATTEVVCFVELPQSAITQVKTKLKLGLYAGENRLETVSTNFMGPVK